MIRQLRKWLRRDTDKLRLEAERENLRREVAANYEASSVIIRNVRETRKIVPVKP
jgi:hypothetical protein